MKRMACGSIVLLLGIAGGSAHAQPSVAVLGVEALDVPSDLATRVAGALKSLVKRSETFKLAPGKDLEEIKLVFGCIDEKSECMARAGSSIGVAKLIWGTLKKAPSGYFLTIKLLDVKGSRIEKFVSENVPSSKLTTANTRSTVEKLCRSFLAGGPGAIKVTCNVIGAQVLLGQQVVGQTTEGGGLLIPDLSAGAYTVQLRKKGYKPAAQEVTVLRGQTQLVELVLEATQQMVIPATQPVAPLRETGNGWKIAFWTTAAATVGMGVGVIVTGTRTLSYQDQKGDAIFNYWKQPGANLELFDATKNRERDVCKEAEENRVTAVDSACKSGEKWALATNILIGTTVAAGLLSFYLGYKAYMSKESAAPAAAEEKKFSSSTRERTKVQWQLLPAAGPDGGSLGLHLKF